MQIMCVMGGGNGLSTVQFEARGEVRPSSGLVLKGAGSVARHDAPQECRGVSAGMGEVRSGKEEHVSGSS